MSAISTIVVSIAAAAGTVALYRFVAEKSRQMKSVLAEARKRTSTGKPDAIIDYERDPDTGIYRPRSTTRG